MAPLRFFPGIIILQIATAVFVFALVTYDMEWVPLAICAFMVSLLVACWFSSIAEHVRKDALAEVKDDFAREREQMIVSAEAAKRSFAEESHRRIVRETNRAHARANFKLGAALVGMLLAGGLLLSVQLFTVGLLTLAAAGGGLAGYVTRGRLEAAALRRRAAEEAVPRDHALAVIESKAAQRAAKRLESKFS